MVSRRSSRGVSTPPERKCDVAKSWRLTHAVCISLAGGKENEIRDLSSLSFIRCIGALISEQVGSRSQLFAADGAELCLRPLRSTGAESFRQTIQVARLHLGSQP